MARRTRRERIREAFGAFHVAVGAVLGAAERHRDDAARAHAEAMAELWLRETGIDAARVDPGLADVLTNPALAGAVERVARDRNDAFASWCAGEASGPARLDDLVAGAAPGSAGAADRWLGVGTAGIDAPAPELWRIGTGEVGVGCPGFPVAVPLLDTSHLEITGPPGTRAAAEAMVESLLMRVVGYFRPGLVQVHVWDIGQFTGSLPGLYPLTSTGVLTVHDPGNLEGLLTDLSDRIRRVHTRVLVGGLPSLAAHARETGTRTEPWVVAVLLGNRRVLADDDQRQLQRVLRGGPACGISVVLVDVPLMIAAPVETVRLTEVAAGPSAARVVATTSMTGPHVTVLPDPPPSRAELTAASHDIVVEHERLRTRVGTFHDLLPPDHRWGTDSSRSGLTAPVGFAEGIPVELSLGDASPHALVGGPSGSGKTNLLLAMIASMAARYSPDELEFYLLDFKEGVSFAQFAPGRRDPTWLPHARLIGVNINTDREFGLALLRHLADEMRHRAEVAKLHEVTKLEEIRLADPEGRWPRIVAVIDEFQFLFAERDAVTRESIRLLEDVARRGRSQGIHLVLASQDVSGIEAFWGRPAIFEQFVLRIGLPRARRIMADVNDATLTLPRWHALINHESGIAHGNEIARIPDATGKDSVEMVQRELYAHFAARADELGPPRLFDGSRAPRTDALIAGLRPSPQSPRAVIGQCIDVGLSPAVVPLPRSPGRNIGVIGTSLDEAVTTLDCAATSLGAQHEQNDAQFFLAPLTIEASPAAHALARRFEGRQKVDRVELLQFREFVLEMAEEIRNRLTGEARTPTFLVVWAVDTADNLLERTGTDALRLVLRSGPEVGVHTIGWWRSPQRLRSLLMSGGSPDDLGCVVGLDVQGAELGTIIPGLPPTWSPRPGRALMFDRARHSRPEVIMLADPDAPPNEGAP